MSRKRELTDLISHVNVESSPFCEQTAYDVMLEILLMMEISDSFRFKNDIIRDTRRCFEKDEFRLKSVLPDKQTMDVGGRFCEK